jgi:non-heme chloroperoxidase
VRLDPLKSKFTLLANGLPVAILAPALTAAITLGGPGVPPPMPSINDPFKGARFEGLPALSRFTARDGVPLAYRAYAPNTTPARGSVVLGAWLFGQQQQHAPDGAGLCAGRLRGRCAGHSGARRVRHKGAHLVRGPDGRRSRRLRQGGVSPPKPATLAGFSAGGGFAMRVAGSPRQRLFQNYLFLSPFISQDAPTYRPDSGGWVSVGLPRIVAISVLNMAGVHWFNDLPVTRFALNEQAKAFVTPEYTFALAINFRPQADYVRNIKAIELPGHVLAGAKDEAFVAERFAEVFRGARSAIPVTLVPDVGHVQLTLQANAIAAAIKAVETMRLGGV